MSSFTANATLNTTLQKGDDAAYSTTHNAATADSEETSQAVMYLGQNGVFTALYYIRRGVIKFDLSSLSAYAVISAATLHVRPDSGTQDDSSGDSISVVSFTPGNDADPATVDYDQLGTTKYTTDKLISSLSIGVDASIAFNAAGLAALNAKVASTIWLGFLTAFDVANTTPTHNPQVLAKGTSDTNKPYIDITYTIPPPAAPSDLVAAAVAATPGSMALTWTDNSTTETSFSIERSANGSTGWTEVLTPAANATSATDTGLSADTTYYYRMRAYRSGDTMYSSYSATANAATAPAAPTSPTCTAASGSTSLTIGWTDVSTTETSYEVERSNDGSSGWANVSGSLAANVTSYVDPVATNSVTRYYRVRAVRSGVNSAYSSNASAKTCPAAPTSPAAVPITATYNITITWADASSDETGFSIERSNNGSTGWAEVGTVSAGVQTYTDTSIAAGDTQKYYRVRAMRSGDSINSPYSSSVNATTAPTTPSSLAVTFTNRLATVTWADNSSTNTTYTIERKRESGSYSTLSAAVAAAAVSYADATTLDVNHTYTYRLTAVRSGDSMSSVAATVTALVPPEEPSGLTAACSISATAASKVQLEWEINSTEETGFLIQRSPDNSSWSTVTTTSAGVRTYEDTGLAIDTTYYYRVKAVGSLANSIPSAVATVLTSGGRVSSLLLAFDKKTGLFPSS